jgi:hypothetical protein
MECNFKFSLKFELCSYTERLLKLTNSDPKMNALLMEVAHLIKSPLALYHPQVAFKVLTKKD